jgi:hypothetical protein
MKIGIAKVNAGIRTAEPKYPPVGGGSEVIEKGREYWVPDNYNFEHPTSLFVEKKVSRKKEKFVDVDKEN